MSNLLDKRIVCTTDYMGNIFGVNQVIPLTYSDTFSEWEYTDCSRQILLSHFLKYPQFRELQWYELREENEMPAYVSFISISWKERIYGDADKSDDNFIKARRYQRVFKWIQCKRYNGEKYWKYKISLKSYENEFYESTLPATQTEYEQYIKSK